MNCGNSDLTHHEAMKLVREKIKLSELGINDIHTRRARNGVGFIIEIPKEEGCLQKTAILAEKMKKKLPSDVKITCLRKSAAIRIIGFDESVIPRELLEELAKMTKCPEDQISMGKVTWMRGIGAVVIHLPVEAAIMA